MWRYDMQGLKLYTYPLTVHLLALQLNPNSSSTLQRVQEPWLGKSKGPQKSSRRTMGNTNPISQLMGPQA